MAKSNVSIYGFITFFNVFLFPFVSVVPYIVSSFLSLSSLSISYLQLLLGSLLFCCFMVTSFFRSSSVCSPFIIMYSLFSVFTFKPPMLGYSSISFRVIIYSWCSCAISVWLPIHDSTYLHCNWPIDVYIKLFLLSTSIDLERTSERRQYLGVY